MSGVSDSSAETPWWDEGLRFRCTACGACCTGEPGHVWVTPDEIRAMARARGISPRRFKERFVRRIGKRLSLRERENGDCVMLEGERCSVYAAKPTRCTTFPFWGPVVASATEWRKTAERCEGIGQGDLYDRESIKRLLTGDPTPLIEKHKREPEQPVVSRREQAATVQAEAQAAATHPSDDPTRASDVDWDAAFVALQRVYDDLDDELPRWEFTCSASGNCCDFDAHGHRLYVTTLEAAWFFKHLKGRANDDANACPAWGPNRLCTERDGRMLGCRTYFCGPYPRGLPEDLHPRYHARIQALHERFGIDYQYRDVRDWAADQRPAPNAGDGVAGS